MSLLGAGLLVSSCGGNKEKTAAAANEPVKVDAPVDPNVFVADKPEQFEMATATAARVRDEIQSNGVVAPDVSRTVPILSLTGGRVVDISARLGDDVKKGQLLLRITSNDLAGAYADYQKALSVEILSRKALDRTKDLFTHGAAPQKDVEAAEDAEERAKVDVRNAAEHIRILGGSVDHPTTILDVVAPVSGTIVEQNIQAAGGVKSLDNSPNLFTIADLSQVWVLCDVYENNLTQIRLGDAAEVVFNALPDRKFNARVSNISRVLDPATRTAKVRLEMPNPGGQLRPGMFAVAHFYSQSLANRISIPASAILRLHDQDWVFRPLGGNRFRRDRIQGGDANTSGEQYVLSGLAAGDQVVKNALQFSAAVEK